MYYIRYAQNSDPLILPEAYFHPNKLEVRFPYREENRNEVILYYLTKTSGLKRKCASCRYSLI